MKITKYNPIEDFFDILNVPKIITLYDRYSIPKIIDLGEIYCYHEYNIVCGKKTINFVSVEIGTGLHNRHSFHNEKGPSIVSISEKKIFIGYYLKNKRHRFGGPAVNRYNLLYQKQMEEYFIFNKLHNSIGPARRIFSNNKWINYYYINGINLTRDQFFKRKQIRGKYENFYNDTNF